MRFGIIWRQGAVMCLTLWLIHTPARAVTHPVAPASSRWGRLIHTPARAVTVDFEEFDEPPYSLGPESYYNGADGAGGFTSGEAFFNNTYTDWGGGLYSWAGWAVSNVTDTTTPGYDNQYSAYTGSGAGGSEFYGVAFVSAFDPLPAIELPPGAIAESLQVTNTTYAALSMLYGDGYAKMFGGDTGADPDWFRLTIAGLDGEGAPTGEIEFYLADYRFDDDAMDYVVDEWVLVDLTPLGAARTLTFGLASTDVGPWGMNTPAYFALDDLTYVPEPQSAALLLLGVVPLWRRRGSARLAGEDRR